MGDVGLILLLLLPFVLLFVFVIRPAQRRNRRADELAHSLQPGQQVMTTSGLYGTILELDDDSVLLEVSQGVGLRFARRAIGSVLVEDEPPPEAAEEN